MEHFWSALDQSLSQLSNEYENRQQSNRRTRSFATTGAMAMKSAFPKISKPLNGEPIKVLKSSTSVSDNSASSSGSSGGVNHLNLIQIKGNPVHNWQPKLVADEAKNMMAVVRPMLNCIQINRLLLKNGDVNPTQF